MLDLIFHFLKNPASLFRYLLLGKKYRYTLKTLLLYQIPGAASLAKKIIQQAEEEIAFMYKGHQIFMRNEIGAVQYMTDGIRKLDNLVNKIELPVNATVIDAGGNVGLFSLFVKQRFPDAKIIVIEPSEKLIPILKKNLQRWNDITFIEKALTEKVGSIIFYINKRAEQTNSTDFNALLPFIDDENDVTEIEVATVDLASVIKDFELPKVDLLKLDIQGGEYNVLQSSVDSFSKINAILAEVSFISEDNVQLCGLLTQHYPKSSILGEVKMGADILFSR